MNKKSNKTNFDKHVNKITRKHPGIKKELTKAGQAWDIALQIRELRKKRGLSQAKLAKLAGVSQPNIARIEDADYQRYTLTTLDNVTRALKAQVDVVIIPEENTTYHRKHLPRPVFTTPA